MPYHRRQVPLFETPALASTRWIRPDRQHRRRREMVCNRRWACEPTIASWSCGQGYAPAFFGQVTRYGHRIYGASSERGVQQRGRRSRWRSSNAPVGMAICPAECSRKISSHGGVRGAIPRLVLCDAQTNKQVRGNHETATGELTSRRTGNANLNSLVRWPGNE